MVIALVIFYSLLILFIIVWSVLAARDRMHETQARLRSEQRYDHHD